MAADAMTQLSGVVWKFIITADIYSAAPNNRVLWNTEVEAEKSDEILPQNLLSDGAADAEGTACLRLCREKPISVPKLSHWLHHEELQEIKAKKWLWNLQRI